MFLSCVAKHTNVPRVNVEVLLDFTTPDVGEDRGKFGTNRTIDSDLILVDFVTLVLFFVLVSGEDE